MLAIFDCWLRGSASPRAQTVCQAVSVCRIQGTKLHLLSALRYLGGIRIGISPACIRLRGTRLVCCLSVCLSDPRGSVISIFGTQVYQPYGRVVQALKLRPSEMETDWRVTWVWNCDGSCRVMDHITDPPDVHWGSRWVRSSISWVRLTFFFFFLGGNIYSEIRNIVSQFCRRGHWVSITGVCAVLWKLHAYFVIIINRELEKWFENWGISPDPSV